MSTRKKLDCTIAIFLPSLHGGGAERAMVMLANGFAQRELAVDLVLVSAVGPYLCEVSPAVNVVNLRQSRVIKSLPGLIRYLRARKPTVLLSVMGHANLVALLAKKMTRVNTRLVVSERNNTPVVSESNESLGSRVVRLLNRYLYRTADAIHGVSYGVAASSAQWLGMPRERIEVVYNPVVTHEILELAQENIEFPELVADGQALIVAAGRLTKQKDFATLIRALVLVRLQSDARLVIMGEGELRSDLEQLINQYSLHDSVCLPGFVENPFAVMSQADLFVLSSAWEGLPSVLIQAMACGTPVVSTACPSGPAEILEDGKWGRLVPVGDAEELAQAILKTLTDKVNPDVATRAAYFSLDRAVDAYLRILIPSLETA